jgi:hypothetical protein
MVHEETRKQRKGAKTDLERIRARQKERRENGTLLATDNTSTMHAEPPTENKSHYF